MSQEQNQTILKYYEATAHRINGMGKYRALKIMDVTLNQSEVQGDSMFERDGEMVNVYTSYGLEKMHPSQYTDQFDAAMEVRGMHVVSHVDGKSYWVKLIDEHGAVQSGGPGDYVVFTYEDNGYLVTSVNIVRGVLFDLFPKFEPTLIAVDTKAFHAVLNAITGPSHLIRELQATRSISALMGEEHPFDILMGQYEGHRQAVQLLAEASKHGGIQNAHDDSA